MRKKPCLMRRSCGARGDLPRHPQAPFLYAPPSSPVASHSSGEAPSCSPPVCPLSCERLCLGRGGLLAGDLSSSQFGGPWLSAPSTTSKGRRGGVRVRGQAFRCVISSGPSEGRRCCGYLVSSRSGWVHLPFLLLVFLDCVDLHQVSSYSFGGHSTMMESGMVVELRHRGS
jgi:hypothetical protein